MPAGLTLGMLIGPIAAATVVNAFWFAAIWRGHQYQRRQGKIPWQFDLALGGYIAANGLALYLIRGRDLAAGIDLFAAAFLAVSFGVVITYGLVYSFVLSRGRPWSERTVPMIATVFLTGLAVAAILTA